MKQTKSLLSTLLWNRAPLRGPRMYHCRAEQAELAKGNAPQDDEYVPTAVHVVDAALKRATSERRTHESGEIQDPEPVASRHNDR